MKPDAEHAGKKDDTQSQSSNQSTPANGQQESGSEGSSQLSPRAIASGLAAFALGIVGNLIAGELQNRLLVAVVVLIILFGSALVAQFWDTSHRYLAFLPIILVLGLVFGLLARDLVDPIPRTPDPPPTNTPSITNVTPSPIAARASISPTVMTYTFDVSGLTSTNVALLPGDKLTIEADGVITAGQSVGDVRPEGKRNFVVGPLPITIDAETYNIVPDYPHGMLMYRIRTGGIGSSPEWEKCGEDCEAIVGANGTLELEVNDSVQGDNEGEFQVMIRVER